MLVKLAVVLIAVPGIVSATTESAEDKFHRQVEDIRAEYRVATAQSIRKARVVELFLLRFDKMTDDLSSEFGSDNTPGFEVAPYGKSTEIITKRKLDRTQCKKLLKSLADQVQKATHTGGALCHFPVHGIRVYSDLEGENLIYSGSFCWVCSNFGFAYPTATDWLDTSESLKKEVNSLLPIPAEEIERFERKFPGKRRAKETKEPKITAE